MQNSRSPRNTRKVGRHFPMPSHNIGHGMCRRSAPHGEKKEKSQQRHFFNSVTVNGVTRFGPANMELGIAQYTRMWLCEGFTMMNLTTNDY